MQLQDIFYLFAIICMTLFILIMIGVVVILFYIKKKISDIHTTINDKINAFAKVTGESSDVALNIGAAVATTAIQGVKKIMHKNDKHKK